MTGTNFYRAQPFHYRTTQTSYCARAHTNALSCMKVQTRMSSNELGTSALATRLNSASNHGKIEVGLRTNEQNGVRFLRTTQFVSLVARASHTAQLCVYPVSVHKGVVAYRWLVEMKDES